MPMTTRDRLRYLVRAILRRHPREPERLWRWVDPPDLEPALVPVGPPRRPLLSDGIALPLPDDD